MITLRQTVITLVGAAVVASHGAAATLFSNLNQPGHPFNNSALFPGEVFANGFVTGPDASRVTGLSFRLFTDDPFGHTAVVVALFYDDANGAPGALLTALPQLQVDLHQGQDAIIDFSYPAGIDLQASHTYWVALSAPEIDFGWRSTYSSAPDGGSASSTVLGARYYTGDAWASLFENEHFMFAVTGDIVPVPEPTPIILLALGLCAFILKHRRPNKSVGSQRLGTVLVPLRGFTSVDLARLSSER